MIVAFLLNLSGCSFNKDTNTIKNSETTKTIVQEENKQIPTSEEIVESLCSDEFDGRMVGTEANKKVENYIAEIYKKIGLDYLFEDTYYEKYTQEVLKSYKIDSGEENREVKEVNNVVGLIKGSNNRSAIVISAHLDHIGSENGQIFRGALDNASGVSAVIQIANILKNESNTRTFNKDIIIAIFNGEEFGRGGSKAFVNEVKNNYTDICNINIDCIGGKNAGQISLNNKSKISNKLTSAIKETFKSYNMNFSNTYMTGVIGDDRSFEMQDIPNIYIGQENIKPYIHKLTDTPDTLNYSEIQKVVEILSAFIISNDNINFKD